MITNQYFIIPVREVWSSVLDIHGARKNYSVLSPKLEAVYKVLGINSAILIDLYIYSVYFIFLIFQVNLKC